jgi:GAF domain-containing protein/HAMP domain-containing protein
MKRLRWRLFPKYATLIIAVVASVLGASSAVSLVFSWREIQAHLVALQNEKAQGAASRIEQYILDIEHQLGWTTLPALDEGADPYEPRRTEYQKLFRLVPPITEVAWIDPNGREQVRISRVAVNVDGSNDDYSQTPKFKVAKAGTTYYGPVYFRKETEPYMTIARPAGLGGGVTAAEVNLKFVWEVVSRIRIGEKGLAWVVDDGGVLIAHPDISLVLRKTDLSSLPQVAALKQPGAAARKTAQGIDGAPVLSANAPIPTLNWTVFVESPETEAFAPLRASILRAGLLLGAGLLAAMVASFFVARALVRPLRQLQEGAARVGAGELDRRIEIRTGDELEGLAEQFNKMASDLKESYAGLERKVAQRTSELSEALEQQTATADILRVISDSITDAQPVFDAIVSSGRRLFDGRAVALVLPRGTMLESVAFASDDAAARTGGFLTPWPFDAASAAGACILESKVIVVADTSEGADRFARMRDLALALGYRSGLFVPLLREGQAIGCFAVLRSAIGDFAAKEIALAQTFADQAVIAIENVRLFNETQEALERQTATAEVLRVISASVTETQPVFDVIAERAVRLTGAVLGVVFRLDGELIHVASAHGVNPQALEATRKAFPRRVGGGTAAERAVRDGVVVNIGDVETADGYETLDIARFAGYRAVLAVPMLREREIVGAIVVTRAEAGLFAQREVDLLQTFASQAVIAIENVRLFNETKEALQQQTATAEVLKVISSSVSDAAPVFETILDSCQRLFSSSEQGVLLQDEDGRLHLGAHHGRAKEALQKLFPIGRDIAGASPDDAPRVLHFKDILADPDVPPGLRTLAERINVGSYSQVITPMMWEGESIGSLYVIRQPPVGFTDKEIGLLRTFADQAVIAIQNARLVNETKAALEHQTATAEVLQVISSSVADTGPVFDKILDSCQRLFSASGLGI